jgi:hypothetical protein
MMRQLDAVVSLACISALLILSLAMIEQSSIVAKYSRETLQNYSSLANTILAISPRNFQDSINMKIFVRECIITVNQDTSLPSILHWSISVDNKEVLFVYCVASL